jgi:N-acetyl-alpha-D-glucosaminyl L-malate synthase BshA
VKRVNAVIEVFSRVRKLVPSRLLMVGDGPDLGEAQRLAQFLNLSDFVQFLGEQDGVVPLLSASDVFLLTSAQESFGLAALEAMACGVPVVASAVGGLPEVIPDGEAGFLRPVGDVAALAEAAAILLADEPRRRAMGAAARRRAETHYRIDPAIDRYLSIYRRVIGRPSP